MNLDLDQDVVTVVFPAISLLFVTFGPTSSASQSEIYTAVGHSHALDTAIHEHNIRDSTCSMCINIGRDAGQL